MATSFKKASRGRTVQPRGTRPSLHNAQLLVSTGVPSLDALLGGGLAVGTVLLVEEDVHGSYSRLLLKYFLSEGVMCGHDLLLASASERPTDTLKDLPGAVSSDHDSQPLPPVKEGEGEEGEEMEIAWRYQNLPKLQSSFSTRFGHFFDLTTSMEASRIQAVALTTFDAMEKQASSPSELYCSLLSTINQTIRSNWYAMDRTATQQTNVLRIGLHSLGSPLWLEDYDASVSPPSTSSHPHTLTLHQFLHSLRALLRKYCAVAMVTIPTHLMQSVVSVRRLERLCDAAVRLESFAGSDKEQSALYKEYHGLFHLLKLPRLNSLAAYLPETLDLAFKLKRKKLSIEKLHLPPEFSDTAQRAQEDASLSGTGQKERASLGGSTRVTLAGGERTKSAATGTSASRTAVRFNVDF